MLSYFYLGHVHVENIKYFLKFNIKTKSFISFIMWSIKNFSTNIGSNHV